MRARRSRPNSSPTIVYPRVINAPAPNPCTIRNTISCTMFWEAPDSAEPARKVASPAR